MDLGDYLHGFQPAVDESVLVDAVAWTSRPGFWPAFLTAVGGSMNAVHAFEIDPADVSAVLDELHRPDRWPVLTLGLASGGAVYLVFRNFPDDSGWDYLLRSADSEHTVEIAALEGHFRGPAWCWPELVELARPVDDDLDAAQRLLLLLPAMADADSPAAAIGQVARSLSAVGASSRQREVAVELLDASRRFWGAPPWGEHNGVRACLGGHSYRGPGRPIDELRRVASLLGRV